MMKNVIRLAIVGGRRGANFNNSLSRLAGRVELVAVCDNQLEVLQRWVSKFPSVVAYSEFDLLLEDPNVDAVYLATPLFIHADQAIRALRAGKHVISEVIAAHTLEDCWALVRAVEETGLTYMMAENYCYTRSNRMIEHMLQQNLFGELTYAECGYTHDVRDLMHDSDGKLTWRGQMTRDFNGSTYPTHSLGPVARWLGINREGGDEFESLVTITSKSRATASYFHEHFGSDHPGSESSFWKAGDATVTLIRTKKGVLIALKYDIQSARPHNMNHYTLQGTEGAYLSPRHDGEDPLIWLANESPGCSPANIDRNKHAEWQPLYQYADQWEHPSWRKWSAKATGTGHGGGDFFVLEEFISAIEEGRRPDIDVYDAVTWSSVFPLSVQSVAAGGVNVPFVDFLKNRK